MGKVYQGIEGPFVGKVGPVVGYTWKHIPCIRAYRHEIAYPNTAMQQAQRDWFVSMVRFASKAREALLLGLRQSANDANMTEGNYFVMRNKGYFQRHQGGIEVNYDKLIVAEGSAADVYFHQARFDADEVVTVDFEKNSMQLRASGDDRVYLYVYAPNMAAGLLSAPAERRCKRLSMRLPSHWAGQVVHLYGFVVDRNGRASNSTYIGEGRVNHYEDRGRYIPINNSWMQFVDMAEYANNQSSTTVVSQKTAETAPDIVREPCEPPEVP